MDHAIAARRDGDRIAIDDVEIRGEYGDVLTTQYLDAEAAIRLGQGLVAIGRQIVAERGKAGGAGRADQAARPALPLATAYVPYPEDAG